MTTVGSREGRIAYLDYVKAISILLVVFCHYTLLGNGSVLGNVIMSLAWGAVPCFFMVSGGLLHQKKEFHWKKYVLRLVQVYLVLCAWKLIYLLVTCLYADISFSKVGLITYLFLFGSLDGVASGVMWFIQDYLLLLIFYPISWFLFRYFSEGREILIFLLGILFIAGPGINAVNLLLQVFAGGTERNLLSFSPLTSVVPVLTSHSALFFFLLGAFLLYYREKIESFFREKMRRVWIPLVCAAVGVTGLMLIRFWQMGSFRWEGTYLENGYTWISTILTAIGLYLLIQNYLGRVQWRWLACLGRNTMGIYYLHFMFLAFLSTTVFWAGLTNHGSVILNLVKTVIITFICMLITMGLRKIPGIKRLVS